MPRLLLVDDNPSIHKIAETLLGPTSVELVCASSGEEAWTLLEGGEAFDVALIDTAMPGLDGWGLLARIREHVPTALLPVAMMAGVLDQVDQAQVDAAPIQGFLKKPIELRELGDRIHQIIATPVDAPASAFKTVPGTSLENLIHPLPETRVDEASMDRDDDLLILEEQDLYPGEPSGLVVAPEPVLQEPVAEAAVSDSLELEELDLDTLKGLDAPELPAPAAHFEDLTPPVPLEDLGPTWADLPALEPEALPEPAPAPAPMAVQVDDLPDLGEELDLVTMPPVWQEPPAALPAPEPILEPVPEPVGEALPEPEPAPIPVAVPAPAPIQAEAPAPVPAAALPEAGTLAQAILADEALMEALARAVVAKLGDRALREIAWELMPDLAEKLRK